VRRLEGLRLLVENDHMGAEFLETIRQVFFEAHKKVLIALVPFALYKHRACVEILAKVFPHIPNNRLVEDIAADGGLGSECRELLSGTQQGLWQGWR
jgi:hypothetical protein